MIPGFVEIHLADDKTISKEANVAILDIQFEPVSCYSVIVLKDEMEVWIPGNQVTRMLRKPSK